MNQPVLQVKGLVKTYGPAVAVDGIDLTEENGEIFGLLGPNGAGKTRGTASFSPYWRWPCRIAPTCPTLPCHRDSTAA